MKLRHVGIVVKDLRVAIRQYKAMGFGVIERDTLRVVKMQNSEGDVIEVIKGRWKPHICVEYFRDENGNFLEVVCPSKS